MRFPTTNLLSKEGGYEYLLDALHPEGLHCPHGHDLPDRQALHDRSRAPTVKYRCRECGSVFNVFTGTLWSGTHYNCREIGLDYSTLLGRRRRIQEQALARNPTGLPDPAVEANEMFHAKVSAGAGKK